MFAAWLRTLVLVLLLLSPFGCVFPGKTVLLRNQTGQVAQCQFQPGGSLDPARFLDECVQQYKRAGFELLGLTDAEWEHYVHPYPRESFKESFMGFGKAKE